MLSTGYEIYAINCKRKEDKFQDGGYDNKAMHTEGTSKDIHLTRIETISNGHVDTKENNCTVNGNVQPVNESTPVLVQESQQNISEQRKNKGILLSTY